MGKIKTRKIMGINISDVTLETIIPSLENLFKLPDKKTIFYANPQTVKYYFENNEFKKAINEASFIYPDGIGIILASRMLGLPLKQRTTLMDFIIKIFKLCEKRGWSIYILGGESKVLKNSIIKIKSDFPNLSINGQHGYFEAANTLEIIRQINLEKPKIVFVAMGIPKQEIWINKNMKNIQAKVFFGIGGSIDILAGRIPRAPRLIHKSGFEWLYRLYKEPKRLWRRYLIGNMVFLYRIVIQILYNSTHGKARRQN